MTALARGPGKGRAALRRQLRAQCGPSGRPAVVAAAPPAVAGQQVSGQKRVANFCLRGAGSVKSLNNKPGQQGKTSYKNWEFSKFNTLTARALSGTFPLERPRARLLFNGSKVLRIR